MDVVKQQHKTVLVWLAFILVIAVLGYKAVGVAEKPAEATFGALVTAVEKGEVKELNIKETGKGVELTGAYTSGAKFVTLGVVSEDLLKKLDVANKAHGTTYTIEPRDDGSVWMILLQWLPMFLIVVLFLFFIRQVQSGGGKAMSFGKSKAKLTNESQNKVTFADVAGSDESKQDLEEIVQFLKDPKKFTRLGGRIPKGVLLMGPPGTGKTLLARAVAGEAGVPFFSIAGSDFVEMFVGVGASRVRDLFEQGKKNAPCIIFIDEIDAVGRHRGAGMGGGHDEREQTLNQLLVEMDGFESNEGVIIVAATNRPDVLDPAILRPGRFDRRIVVNRPDVRGREGILRVHTKKVPLGTDVNLEILARGTPGFVGADLENLVNEAALLAARQDKDVVTMSDFEMAKDKVMMGAERRSMVINDEEKKTTAWHEAGHALVAKLLEKNSDPVHKVTIIPRGPALGLTQQLPKEDRLSMSRDFAKARLAVCMGGRVAEEIVFGQFTTGAGNDIKQASNLARRMVTEFGMSDVIGPISYSADEESVFLGRDFNSGKRSYSETIANQIDDEVRKFIMDAHAEAHRLISENREVLNKMAEALLEHETLDGDDIDKLVAGGELAARTKVVIPTYSDREKAAKEKRRAASIFGAPKPVPGT